MKNKNSKKTVLLFSIFLLIGFLIIYGLGIQTHKEYSQEFIRQEQILISGILEKYPELEDDIIESLLNNDKEYNIGISFFEKYGIDLESFDNLEAIYVLKKETLTNILLVYIFIIIVFGYLLFRHLYKEHQEIKKMNEYLDHVLSKDYSLDIREYDEGDMNTLKNDIYKVTTLLREQEHYSKQEKKYLESVLSDISHQLKTPLTSMYVINDILENDEIELSKKKEMLSKNKNQLKRIEWLVTSLLKLSRLDSGVVQMKPEKVLVEKLIQQALDPLRIPIELKEQNIIIEGNQKMKAELDFEWTVEALVNLFKNAHEHTANGGTIQINYKDNPIYVEIQIQDNGEGIEATDLPHIFERFYKGNSNNKESIGIGLNMAASIIQKQNGTISVQSKKEKGTTFTIRFYKNII